MLQIATAVQAAGWDLAWDTKGTIEFNTFLALGIKTVLQLHFALRKMTQAESIN